MHFLDMLVGMSESSKLHKKTMIKKFQYLLSRHGSFLASEQVESPFFNYFCMNALWGIFKAARGVKRSMMQSFVNLQIVNPVCCTYSLTHINRNRKRFMRYTSPWWWKRLRLSYIKFFSKSLKHLILIQGDFNHHTKVIQNFLNVKE